MMNKDQPILLIEDSDNDAEMIKFALRSATIANRLMRCYDGVEALDYVFARGDFAASAGVEPPALVLLDLHLPRLSGVEVLIALRETESTKNLPVIVLSESEYDRERIAKRRLAPVAFAGKPLDIVSFLAAVRSLQLRLWLEGAGA